MHEESETVHALVGPTAVGKSELALAIAERAGAEILSMDSMLVYRGLDVGTAKPPASERARVPHHLMDLVEAGETFTVASWLEAARAAEEGVRGRGGRALYVGGTAFYLKALLFGIFDGPRVDPELRARLTQRAAREGGAALHAELQRVDPASAARIHANDTVRLVRALEVHAQTGRPLSSWQTNWGFHGEPAGPGRPARLVGLTRPRAALERRIRARATAMLDRGWPEEASALRSRGGLARGAAQALGYAEVLAFVDGELDREAAIERITVRTRQFARRQGTWLRRFPGIVWIDLEAPDSVLADPVHADPAHTDPVHTDRGEHLARALAALGWDRPARGS